MKMQKKWKHTGRVRVDHLAVALHPGGRRPGREEEAEVGNRHVDGLGGTVTRHMNGCSTDPLDHGDHFGQIVANVKVLQKVSNYLECANRAVLTFNAKSPTVSSKLDHVTQQKRGVT